MQIRLDCGHTVNVELGDRLYCHYDTSFGVVIDMGYGDDPWLTFNMDGSPYKSIDSRGYYNAQRLACCDCGMRAINRRQNDKLVVDDFTWEIVRP